MDELFLMAKLDDARIAVDAARRAAAKLDVFSPEYQQAQITYLHAVVRHLSIIVIAQAAQQERLSADVAGLRERLDGPTVH